MQARLFLIIIVIFYTNTAFANDANIRRKIISDSINSYSGNCPCPYNRASNGSKCGKRSAYFRKGGRSTICFDSDITDNMIRTYKGG